LCDARILNIFAGTGEIQAQLIAMASCRRQLNEIKRGASMSVEKKVILVTGAARGIGREYCQRLAALGAAVMAVDINACDETIEFIKRAGGGWRREST
jgi:FlaA1/EpsC-like NDP-sugar epimerase